MGVIIFHLHGIANLNYIFLAEVIHIAARLLTFLGIVCFSCVPILLCAWKDLHN